MTQSLQLACVCGVSWICGSVSDEEAALLQQEWDARHTGEGHEQCDIAVVKEMGKKTGKAHG